MNPIPNKLRDRLRDRRVIPFVGAGVSMSVQGRETGKPLFPSWRQLLERAAEELDNQQRSPYATAIRAQLQFDNPNYLSIAQIAREGLIGSNWFNLLLGQFGHLREQATSESLGLAQAIWGLGSSLIITTNYDNVLRWASPNPSDLHAWDIDAPANQLNFLQGGTLPPTIWYLHGKIDNAANIILTPDGYNRLYPEAKSVDVKQEFKAALHTLRTSLATYTFLFIGYSLDDYNFGVQLKGMNEIYQGLAGPHFVLARESERARIASLDSSLQVITFEDYGEPLLKLVRQLGEVTQAEETPRETEKIQLDAAVTAPRVADYGPHHSVFFVSFRPKGEQVVGREETLQAVRKQLTEGRRTAIGQTASFQGLGGLGKTQLAVEYAYRFKDAYPNGVIWLNADQNIDAQLTELAEKARWVAPESEHKYKLEVAQHRLRTYSDCLLIFDNLEDIEDIKNYLPEPQASPHLLVTSRSDQPSFSPIPIDPLDETLSLELLFQEAGRKPLRVEEEIAAHNITKELGGLPLALEMAGAYLRHREVSWQQYLDLLSQNPRAALLNKFPSFTRHEADIYSTLKINEDLFKEEPKLRDILDLLTWSSSAPMGVPLMSILLGTQNSTELTNALGLGLQLRLLQKTSDSDSYLIHRLVSKVRREEILLETRLEWVSDICQRLGNWFQELKESFIDLPQFEAEIPHLRTWQQQATKYAPLHASRLLWLQAYPPYHRGQYQEAKDLVEKALELFEKQQIDNNELYAHLLNDMGVCLGALGKNKNTLEYQERALALRLQLFGEEHPDTASSLNGVGSIYQYLGDYKRALEYVERALNINLQLFGEEHPDTASSLNNVGSIYQDLGDYKRALEYAERALNVYLHLPGEEHPDTASSLNSIGSIYQDLGDYKRALEYVERDLAISLQLFGEQHPHTASSLNSIGGVYRDLGDYKRALEYVERDLAISLQLFGEEHPDTASSLNGVGSIYRDLGDYKRALEYAERALNINLQLLGEQHPHTATSLNSIGSIYQDLGDYKRALEFAERALNVHLQLLGEEHPHTASSLNNVGGVYRDLGDHKRALEYAERALNVYLQLFGEEHPDTAMSLNNVGSIYQDLGDYKRALEFAERASNVRLQVLGEQHPRTASSLNNVGSIYQNLGDYKRALEYVERAFKVRMDLLGTEHSLTISSAVNVASILCTLKSPLRAFQLLDKILSHLPPTHLKYSYLKEQHSAVKNLVPGLRRQKRIGKKKR